MDQKTEQLIKKYIDVVLARKAVITTFLFIMMLAGLAVYTKIPKVYQATALLIYERQAVNPSKMSPDLKSRTREIVSTLMQQVTSRTSLEKIIKEFNLYLEAREKLPIEDVIESMRKRIRISPTKGDIFQVSFDGENPKKVLRVTNALSSKFIEENLKYREERATETSSYIANELNLSKRSLDKKEQAMRDYKLKYYNELPEQREINVSRANTLQVKLQGVQDNIQELERTKVVLQEQVGLRKRALSNLGAGQAGGDTDQIGSDDPYERLSRMKAHLDALLLKYKDTHPEVKRVRKSIVGYEQQLNLDDTGAGGSGEKTSSVSRRSLVNRDPVLQQAAIQRKSIELNLVELRSEESDLKRQISTLEEWISAAPVREAEWSALTRDYSQFKKHYDYLVAQNIQASSVQNLERKQQGSQFKIMDPPRLPTKPIKPDFLKIMILAIGVGFALGGGLAIGLDLLDTSFKDPLDIEEILGVSVVCSIPYIPLKKETRISRIKEISYYLYLLVGCAIICAALYYLWSSGRLII